MDSAPRPGSLRPALAPEAPAVLETAAPPGGEGGAALEAASPGALARLGRIVPGVGALVRFAYRTAAASAVAAAVIWLALFEGALRSGAVGGVAVIVALLLLVPAAAAALAGWTLADLASLPGQLRDAALAATGRADAAQPAEARPRRAGRSRLLRVGRALWAARGLALTSKGAWVRIVGAARFLRLASLPFALALVGLFALNGLVILGGAVALVVLLF
ncbi:hypothetical protein RQM47_06445 [Rubrivirga sp. S365]|uniref:Uncharacterized protein n=1 Tax=Rubrivirga litoralis TaxID=3075598 RepID=A0ABU3BN58_9BACT|nr:MULTISPECIES: hypothetical protein [unclassified Rubrivirga]MDT0630700.1 hypothetical protein [Rubrivirga sp. F394]MDT7856272.1 hypothetical protein [Rubrivirga sp. S365]